MNKTQDGMVELTDVELSRLNGSCSDGWIQAVADWLYCVQHPDTPDDYDYGALWDGFDNAPVDPLPASTMSDGILG